MKPANKLFTILTLLALMLALTPLQAVHTAGNIIVTSNADSGAGSLRQTIADAAAGDTITFDSALSGQTIILASTLTLDRNITIDGSSLALLITISGNNAVRVLYVNSGVTVILNSLTVSNGYVYNEDGSGLYNNGALTVIDSTFSDNNTVWGSGGGIYSKGALTVHNSTFSDNLAWIAGGGILNSGGNATITNSTFSGNDARFGGNSVTTFGGGLSNDGGGIVTITGSTFSGNSASDAFGGNYFGGGVHNDSGTVSITNSTFTANSAANGGGLSNYGTTTITNSTFSGNNATVTGSEIHNDNYPWQIGTVTVANTIVANSASGGNCGGTPIINGGNNIDDGTTCGFGSTNGSLSSANPYLGALTGGPAYFPLLAGSPAIDSIIYNAPNGCPTTDQRGVARPQGLHCDIGAFEVDNTSPTVTSITRANANPTAAASVDITITFSEAVTGVGTVAPFSDFALITSSGISGASISGVSGSGATYTITINTGSGSGTIRLDVPVTATITDLVGNPLSGLPFITGEAYTVRSVNVYIGGALKGSYFLISGQSTRQNYAGVDNGPVKVVSSNGVPIISAIRSAWAVNGVTTSFSQLMGLPLEQLSDTYVFPGYNNVTLNEQLRIANVDTIPTSVTVTIGGTLRGTYPLAAGAAVRINYPGLDSGPVIVKSTSGVKIISSIREAWAVNGVTKSFVQLMGLPAGQLSNKYVFPAYNNVTLNEQLRIGNVDTVATSVTVTIGGNLKGTYPLGPGQAVRVNYPGLDSGPVIVEGTADVNIISSIRSAWAVNGVTTSFSQLMGMPAEQLSDKYLFPGYNNVTLNDQLRIANVDTVPTTVTVTIGGNLKGTYPLSAGGAVRINYAGLDSGPVVVQGTSGVKIISSIREAWAVNGVTQSFVQLMGLPAGQLSTIYFFPGYNNVTLNEQLRIGMP